MRICLYTSTALPKRGGQEIVVDALARQLAALGEDVVVLAPTPRRPIAVNDSAFPYPVVRHPRFLSTKRFVGWYRWFLHRLHRDWRFEVLHCHGVYPAGFVGSLVREKLGVPVVLTSHGGTLVEGNHRLRGAFLRERQIAAVTRADMLVAISELTAQGYASMGSDQRKIVFIPNGVKLEPVDESGSLPPNREWGLCSGKYVLFLGRLKHRKGADLLLDAWTRLASESSVQLAIAGDGEERRALESKCAQLGLGQKVQFLGWVAGKEKTWLLQNALCTVVPSRWSEAFGLTALESYAAGRPVVATNIPGLRELVIEGETGTLVEPESVGDLARALRERIQRPALAVRQGGYARRFAEEYDWPTIGRRHLDLYRSLVQAGRPAAVRAPSGVTRI